jgi:CHAD domain-containing protein
MRSEEFTQYLVEKIDRIAADLNVIKGQMGNVADCKSVLEEINKHQLSCPHGVKLKTVIKVGTVVTGIAVGLSTLANQIIPLLLQ